MTNAGLSKFVEEVGEALQVVGKALGVGGVHNPHWQGDLVQPLQNELGDSMAAIITLWLPVKLLEWAAKR